jgi:hypothetical protein
MQLYRLIYYFQSALHVSGDVFAHHQEYLTVFTASTVSTRPRHQPAATLVNTTRCCKYGKMLLMMSENRPKHVQLTGNNKLTYIVASRCRSQCPRGLRRRSAAARLLRSWVWIPPEKHRCLSVVSIVCCQVEVSANSWSLVQKSPTDCGASLCVI